MVEVVVIKGMLVKVMEMVGVDSMVGMVMVVMGMVMVDTVVVLCISHVVTRATGLWHVPRR